METLQIALILAGAEAMIRSAKCWDEANEDVTICVVDGEGNDLDSEEIVNKILTGEKILVCVNHQFMFAEFCTIKGKFQRVKFTARHKIAK